MLLIFVNLSISKPPITQGTIMLAFRKFLMLIPLLEAFGMSILIISMLHN